jgi:hypothetical protein
MLIVAEVIGIVKEPPSGAKRRPGELDHSYLKEIEGLENPTAKSVAVDLGEIKRQTAIVEQSGCAGDLH